MSHQKLNIKYHSLTGRIDMCRMKLAFKAVKRNRGAAGVDRVDICMFEDHLEQNLISLMKDLKSGALQPMPLRREYISKDDGRPRPLGIPAVRDRVAQEVLRQLLSPIFEDLFHDQSHGFRPGRSCRTATEQIRKYHREGFSFVLDADIKGFFDRIPHAVIMQGLRNAVSDGNVLNLIEKFLRCGVMEDGVIKPTTVGTPQGGVISPLLANIALNFLDWHLHDLPGCRFVRYADDFVVLCRTARHAEGCRQVVEQFVTETLSLELSPEKTHVTNFRKGFDFLGFRHQSHSLRMRDKSVEKFKNRIRELTVRHRNLDQSVIDKLNSVIRGVANFFAISGATVQRQFRSLDGWIRKRLRSMKLKRISRNDNFRVKVKHIRRDGMVFLSDVLEQRRVRGL